MVLIPSMLPSLSSPLVYIFSSILAALALASIALAHSGGVGTSRPVRLSLHAGSRACHPFLEAS
jgi:hypothetical protein